jgi:DNA-directed RNA polymerase specialized sigma24 family protein
MDESSVIEQLSSYRQKLARIEVLSTYSVGAGITVSRLNEDDQLQELHRKLRGLPSYMYLNKREQKLESMAHAYLGDYPAGVLAQYRAVPSQGADPEDTKLLRELRSKIEKVIEARGWDVRDDIDEVLIRVAELQDLRTEVAQIDAVMDALEKYKPDYASLLRLRYIHEVPWETVAAGMRFGKTTFFRYWRKAIDAYIELAK